MQLQQGPSAPLAEPAPHRGAAAPRPSLADISPGPAPWVSDQGVTERSRGGGKQHLLPPNQTECTERDTLSLALVVKPQAMASGCSPRAGNALTGRQGSPLPLGLLLPSCSLTPSSQQHSDGSRQGPAAQQGHTEVLPGIPWRCPCQFCLCRIKGVMLPLASPDPGTAGGRAAAVPAPPGPGQTNAVPACKNRGEGPSTAQPTVEV